jgi:hypothetical protein
VTSNDYEQIIAPDSLVPLDSNFRWSRHIVDYEAHPAYADLIKTASFGKKGSALLRYAARFTLLLTKRVIRYEMIPFENRNPQSLRDRIGFVISGFRNAFGFGNKKADMSNDPPALAQLNAHGVAVIKMPEAQFDRLQSLAKPDFDTLVARRGVRANRREFDESRMSSDRRQSPDLFTFVETILADSGLAAAADAYMGRKVKLMDINPQINDPSDSFWRDIFEDRPGIDLPRTAYCHRDSSGGDLKAIIYMTDVGTDEGPFSFAVGSNHMVISQLDNLLCEANDHNSFSGTDLDARASFAALPAKLRQKGAFGNDLDDAAPLSHQIANALWEIKGSKGSIVLFDTKGVHRGGMVDAGERRVITCVLG